MNLTEMRCAREEAVRNATIGENGAGDAREFS